MWPANLVSTNVKEELRSSSARVPRNTDDSLICRANVAEERNSVTLMRFSPRGQAGIVPTEWRFTKVPAGGYAISFSNLLHRDNGTLYSNTGKPVRAHTHAYVYTRDDYAISR